MPEATKHSSPPRVTVTATAGNLVLDDNYIRQDQRLGRAKGGSANMAPAPCKTQLPSVDAFEAGSGIDVILRTPSAPVQVAAPLLSAQHQTIPFNDLQQSVAFETPLFKGTVQVLLKRMVNTPAGVFDGKRRKMWMNVQGQFKQPVSFDTLMLGSEFERPLKLPAGALLSKASMWLVQRMGSGVQLNTTGDHPHILAPLIAAAQVVNVSLPGQQPSPLEAEEDMTLFDGGLVNSWTGKPMTASKRRSSFSSKSNRQGREFDTQHVWTFQVYDQTLDYSTFLLPIPFFKVDLIQVLDGQPMLLMLKDVSSNQPAMKLEVWHKRMLQHKSNSSQGAAAAVAAAGSRSSHSGGRSSSSGGSWKLAAAAGVMTS